MIKLLIVDDEYLVVDWLKKTIDWDELGIEVVGDASDGKQALEMIDSLKPDMLLLDIHMPVMNGIELVKYINQNNMDVKIIILSGVEEFDYVHKALNLGVKYYILKPSANEEVIMVIKQVIDLITTQRRDLEEKSMLKSRFSESIPLLKNKIMLDIIKGKKHFGSDLDDKLKLLGVEMDNQNFCVLVINIDDYSVYLQNRSEEEIHSMRNGLSGTVTGILESKGIRFMLTDSDNELVVLFGIKVNLANSIEVRKVKQNIREIAEQIKEAAGCQLKVSVSIGISRIYKGFEFIGTCCREAVQAVKYKVYAGKGSINHIEDMVFGKDCTKNYYSVNDEKTLLAAVEAGRTDEAGYQLEKVFNNIRDKKAASLESIQKICIELVTFTNRVILDIGIDMNAVDAEIGSEDTIFNGILKLETLDDLYRYITDIILNITNYINKIKLSSKNSVIEKAKSYIKSHFNEEITLEEVAEHIGLSFSYFSEIFKKEAGMNFIEYLTRVRIDKAKKYLINSELKTYEVSEMVGYRDSRYFSQIFRKYEGVTPTEYRERQRNHC